MNAGANAFWAANAFLVFLTEALRDIERPLTKNVGRAAHGLTRLVHNDRLRSGPAARTFRKSVAKTGGNRTRTG